jgi:hypothetical protein
VATSSRIRHVLVAPLSNKRRILFGEYRQEIARVDIEVLLRALEASYQQALRTAVIAKAVYLALLDEPGSTRAAIQHARKQWERHDAHRREIAAGMGDIG